MRQEVKKDTNRIAKVNSLIQHELGPVLHEFLDWQNGLVTITKVETSKDMKWAKVWISIFNPNAKRSEDEPRSPLPIRKDGKSLIKTHKKIHPAPTLDDKILKFLTDNIYNIQGEVNKHFHTKIIPRISFHLDTSPRYAQHIDEVLRKIHSEEKP
jgi:ribosome-binding factor A